MEDTAPLWQNLLGWSAFAAAVIGPVLAIRWARRRRLRGEEATTSNAEGAEGVTWLHGSG